MDGARHAFEDYLQPPGGELGRNGIIRQPHDAGAIAQFAGGVPAMCDGVTQGQTGMELSLFSRDTIAMATSVALSHKICLIRCGSPISSS